MVAFLAVSVAGLFAGPALAALGTSRRAGTVASAATAGLALGLVPIVVAVRLLPHAAASIGWWALVLAVAGFMLLFAVDRVAHRRVKGARGLGVVQSMVLPALALHALTDGATLAAAMSGGRALDGSLALALLVHRLPEGLFVATVFLPHVGLRGVVVRVAVLAAATIAGALAGQSLLAHIPEAAVDGVVAFGLGALLHVVVHGHGSTPRSTAERAAMGAGFALGAALALGMPGPQTILTRAQPLELSVLDAIGPLFVETAPALLVGLLVGAIVAPPRLEARLTLGRAAHEALGPVAGWVAAALMTLRLLGVGVTVARLLATAALLFAALAVAWAIARVRHNATPLVADAPVEAPRSGPLGRALAALDALSARYLVALVVAAIIEAALRVDAARGMALPATMLFAVGLTLVLAIGPLAATPLAALFVHKGLSPEAALGFLLAASLLSRPLLAFLRSRVGLGATVAYVVVAVAGAIGCSIASGRILVGEIPQMHPLFAHSHARVEQLAAILLAALMLASVVRLGPRAFFARLREPLTS
jgi:hypothetical protein